MEEFKGLELKKQGEVEAFVLQSVKEYHNKSQFCQINLSQDKQEEIKPAGYDLKGFLAKKKLQKKQEEDKN